MPEIAIDRQILHQGQEFETITDLVIGTIFSAATLWQDNNHIRKIEQSLKSFGVKISFQLNPD